MHLPVLELDSAFPPYALFRHNLGFVPNLFRAQSLLPALIEAEARLAEAILLREGSLPNLRKGLILLLVSDVCRNTYCTALVQRLLDSMDGGTQKNSNWRNLRLTPKEKALIDFALRLARDPHGIGPCQVQALRRLGWSDQPILEAVLCVALGEFLCSLSAGLDTPPDAEPPDMSELEDLAKQSPELLATQPSPGRRRTRGYLEGPDLGPDDFAPFAFLRDRFGFVPNLFRAQTLRSDVVEAEVQAIDEVLLNEDILSRVQKELILLVCSSSNLNTYCVTVHCELLRHLGVARDRSEQIALNHRLADLPNPEKALLDFALKLTRRRRLTNEDFQRLHRKGFSQKQALEAVAMTALTRFLNTIQMGLGPEPDFSHQARASEALPVAERTPTGSGVEIEADEESDSVFVERTQGGDDAAFETLVHRHKQRLYRTLLRITGNQEDAEDGLQNAFLKAFAHIDQFRRDSKFSTWLMRIAINEGFQSVRSGRRLNRIHGGFPPENLTAWTEDPEELLSRKEFRELVETTLLRMPMKYRLAVILRDVEQMSASEAAEVLGLRVATLKTRLLRGRLMLREALAPAFTNPKK